MQEDRKLVRSTKYVSPYQQSFSAVVGPNGSGKSNVIDALLFVLGYRAKKMRQTKLSDLIHNSENSQNLESCTVDIYFEEIVDIVICCSLLE